MLTFGIEFTLALTSILTNSVSIWLYSLLHHHTWALNFSILLSLDYKHRLIWISTLLALALTLLESQICRQLFRFLSAFIHHIDQAPSMSSFAGVELLMPLSVEDSHIICFHVEFFKNPFIIICKAMTMI